MPFNLSLYNNQRAKQKINIIACPGLGTGIGQMPYTEAARQMALAYNHFLYPPKHLNSIVAAQRQLQIWEGGDLIYEKSKSHPSIVLC
jgi:O-acetyl-ADP-ribose deacetylase (regulator of RNase III)